MNVVRLAKSAFLLSAIGLLSVLIACTGVASAQSHGNTGSHKCAKHKQHCHKKHHKKSKQAPQPKTETSPAPAPTPAPAPAPAPVQPPAEPELPYIQLEAITQIELNEEQVMCAHVESPHNDPMTVHFKSILGVFANGGAGTPVLNNVSCAVYTGPSVLPEGEWPFDLVEAVVWDSVTGLSNWSIEVAELVGQAH